MAENARQRGVTVQQRPPAQVLLLNLMMAAGQAPVWWSPARDRFLADFWPAEPYLAGAVYSIASRNASYRFELEGPADDVEYAQHLFASADLDRGWQSFMLRLATDLLTQDNGAFIEIIRPAWTEYEGKVYPAQRVRLESGEYRWVAMHDGQAISPLDASLEVFDSPHNLPIGLAHLDSQRCERTGDPDYPVIYTDSRNRRHRMAWWQAATLEDLPSPREEARGVGFCAVSRVLRAAQVLQAIGVYKYEKVSGRFVRAIHLTNVGAQAIEDAIKRALAEADARGLEQYTQPIIADTVDPRAEPRVETIELASLPDGFDEEQTLRWYVACLALGFGVDYTYLAPLPGGGLGSATQVETQERQARGKSARLFMKTFENIVNTRGILPQGVTFRFREADLEEERATVDVQRARFDLIQGMLQSQVIGPKIARQMASDAGLLDPKYLALLEEEDIVQEVVVPG